MCRLVAILLLPLALGAAEHWTRFRAGPFEIYTAAGDQAARHVLNELEQLRHALQTVLGKQEMTSVWPVRLVLFGSSRQSRGYPVSSFKMARDGWVGGIVKGKPAPLRECARILLEANTGRMPESTERGLLAVFSTLDVDATRVTLGAPVPVSERDQNWATMHLLTVSPQYGGRARVLFSNLEQGADWMAAYRNAFEKTPAQIDVEAERYLAAGTYTTRKLFGAPINPERDFRPRDVEPAFMRTILADLLEGDAAQAGYRSVLNEFDKSPESLEGLGLFAEAVEAGSESARCHLEAGRLLTDKAEARAAFQKAAELNPRWAEPHFRLALIESNPAMKARNLKQATQLEPRNTAYWEALAETHLAANSFGEAGKAWAAAERSAVSDQERERLRLARREVETQRTDYIAAQREKREQELQRLRDEMMERIRAAEEEARPATPETPSEGSVEVVEWWDDPRPSDKIRGVLERVDCTRGVLRLVIRGEGETPTQVLIRDPAKIVVLGGGEKSLGCGPQQPLRTVEVQYVKQPDEKLATVGEVTAIEFQ